MERAEREQRLKEADQRSKELRDQVLAAMQAKEDQEAEEVRREWGGRVAIVIMTIGL